MRRLSLAIVAVLLAALALAPAAVAARPVTSADNLPVNGDTATGGALTGTLDNLRFVSEGGQLLAVGDLTATITNAAGDVIGTVTDLAVELPVLGASATGTCDILHLVLGPLDLDLLGLQVHLDQIVLDIVAQSGAGNLLGNLLCAVAGLLDGGLPTNALANLLNQILGLLG